MRQLPRSMFSGAGSVEKQCLGNGQGLIAAILRHGHGCPLVSDVGRYKRLASRAFRCSWFLEFGKRMKFSKARMTHSTRPLSSFSIVADPVGVVKKAYFSVAFFGSSLLFRTRLRRPLLDVQTPKEMQPQGL